MSLKILALVPRDPGDLDTGAKIRTFHLLAGLQRHFGIRVLAYFGPERRSIAETIGAENVVWFRPYWLERRNVLQIARWFVRNDTISVQKYWAPEFLHLIRTEMGKGFDVLYFDHVHMSVYNPFIGYPNVLGVLDEHNVEFLILERMAAATLNPLKRYAYLRQSACMRSTERSSILNMDLVSCVSSEDRNALIDVTGAPNNRLVVWSNGVDLGRYRGYKPIASCGADDSDLVFVGSMDWRPNQDGIAWFLDKVMPLLRKERGIFPW